MDCAATAFKAVQKKPETSLYLGTRRVNRISATTLSHVISSTRKACINTVKVEMKVVTFLLAGRFDRRSERQSTDSGFGTARPGEGERRVEGPGGAGLRLELQGSGTERRGPDWNDGREAVLHHLLRGGAQDEQALPRVRQVRRPL